MMQVKEYGSYRITDFYVLKKTIINMVIDSLPKDNIDIHEWVYLKCRHFPFGLSNYLFFTLLFGTIKICDLDDTPLSKYLDRYKQMFVLLKSNNDDNKYDKFINDVYDETYKYVLDTTCDIWGG